MEKSLSNPAVPPLNAAENGKLLSKKEMRRTAIRFLTLLALVPCVSACGTTRFMEIAVSKPDPQARFEDIGLVFVEDAVEGAKMKQVVFSDDRGTKISSPAALSRQNRGIFMLNSGRVPQTMRVQWREGAGWDDRNKVWNEGRIVGDYTVSVADRIPDTVLTDIRTHGGALRLKFRLKPDGVLFGWDIQRTAPLGDVSIFEMAGGDFLETRY
jgi:hypothetical protein